MLVLRIRGKPLVEFIPEGFKLLRISNLRFFSWLNNYGLKLLTPHNRSKATSSTGSLGIVDYISYPYEPLSGRTYGGYTCFRILLPQFPSCFIVPLSPELSGRKDINPAIMDV
ncbi:112aa long hypothetical protein [Pyrococcus horikoshii OT3]|uniref:Uncharacterized protein n=1 Tax=Pyrococcus horikoshii (strain ATCC 700860 / DSM 12428 / JCM 9974 / NBRC 100139 / OT-3) TaxID=70601 RepID=O57751_PYRHO|nr:112aa long hypothetical protein [Pyrococcus horikoshii OT3]